MSVEEIQFGMRTHPLISVIVPAYNAEPFLLTALTSAQAQTHRDLEIIIVNDGSTDDTLTIAQTAAKSDHRIRVISQDNCGVAAARNRGLAEAHGEYVAPLDADDVWHPENLALQLAALQAAGPGAAVSHAWHVVIDENAELQAVGAHIQLTKKREILRAECDGNFIGNASSTLIRREAIEQVGGYDCSLRARHGQGCEDQALYMTLAERWDFVFVPQYLIAYRNHPLSMSKDSAQMNRSYLLALADLRRRRPDLPAYWFGHGVARLHEPDLTRALRRREWRNVGSVLARAANDGNWCLIDLVGRRLPPRAIGFCVRRFLGRNGNQKKPNPPVDIFWADATP